MLSVRGNRRLPSSLLLPRHNKYVTALLFLVFGCSLFAYLFISNKVANSANNYAYTAAINALRNNRNGQNVFHGDYIMESAAHNQRLPQEHDTDEKGGSNNLNGKSYFYERNALSSLADHPASSHRRSSNSESQNSIVDHRVGDDDRLGNNERWGGGAGFILENLKYLQNKLLGKAVDNDVQGNTGTRNDTACDTAKDIKFPYEPQGRARPNDNINNRGQPTNRFNNPHRPYKWKILCWVLTNPANLKTRTIYVKKSWGPRCDKTLYLSTYTDPSFPTVGLLDLYNQSSNLKNSAVQIVHQPQRSAAQHQSDKNLVHTTAASATAKKLVESKQLNSEKATRAWTYIYDNYHDEYDFFYKTDDDTYVIVENLRGYLETKDPNEPEFYGHRFILRGKNVTYMSGGSGFVLTRKALKQLVTYAFKNNPTCIPRGAGEDWKTARCLEMAGCRPVDTRDELGRERFLVFPPKSHLAGTYPAWYYKYDVDGSVKGAGCCAYYPISFHYIRGTELLMIDYFLYRMRVLGDENFWDSYVPGQRDDIADPTKPTTAVALTPKQKVVGAREALKNAQKQAALARLSAAKRSKTAPPEMVIVVEPASDRKPLKRPPNLSRKHTLASHRITTPANNHKALPNFIAAPHKVIKSADLSKLLTTSRDLRIGHEPQLETPSLTTFNIMDNALDPAYPKASTSKRQSPISRKATAD